jgi:hypothetical protein
VNTSRQHAIRVRRWRDDVKVALVKFEEVRKQRTIDGDTIPTYDHAMLILAAAKRLRLASGQLTAAIDDWIDAHEPPLRDRNEIPSDAT